MSDMEPVASVVDDLKIKIKEKLRLPKFSNNRNYMGCDGEVTTAFLHYLCMDEELMYEFLRRCRLLSSTSKCHFCNCNADMILMNTCKLIDEKIWSCPNLVEQIIDDRIVPVNCSGSRSIRHGSWFSLSNLSIPEVLWISYAIINKTPVDVINREYCISKEILNDWATICREVYVYHVEVNSKKIGGPDKVVEVDESKFGGSKDDDTDGQWVLGGIERGSGECFLIPIKDRTSDTLVRIIKDWVQPGTTIVSDSWVAYKGLQEEGFNHQPANYKKKGANCNTIEGTWRHIKASIPPNSKDELHFVGYLAAFMFHRHCKAKKVDVFVKFLETVRSMYPC